MMNQTILKKQLQDAINNQLEIAFKDGFHKKNLLDYKDVVGHVVETSGMSQYEVLNYMKSLENEGMVRFYPLSKKAQEGIGMVSETYRLKLEEQLTLNESDYLQSFVNEALILNLCS